MRALFMLSYRLRWMIWLGRRSAHGILKAVCSPAGALREEEQRTPQRFYIDQSGWRANSRTEIPAALIQQAVWEDRMLEVRYLSILGSGLLRS